MKPDSSAVIVEKLQSLSDIELAVLICLIADQHCIIEAEQDLIGDIEIELQLIASNVFGLTCAVLDCSEQTSLDDFGQGILVQEEGDDYFKNGSARGPGQFSTSFDTPKSFDRRQSKSPRPFSPLEGRKIANIVIAKHLNTANAHVQVQALELMRGKRNFTRTAVHAAPKTFVFIALNVLDSSRMKAHLNDQFFISHNHHIDYGFPNLEELQEKSLPSGDQASASSVIRTLSKDYKFWPSTSPIFSSEELSQVTALVSGVNISSEVRAYIHNIVVFMRLHRAVADGISALATRHFNELAQTLAPLHGSNYISPSLIQLAARKIYRHRIVLTEPENERSMQWGSSLEAVKAVLEGVTVEDVIEEVLQSVEVPL